MKRSSTLFLRILIFGSVFVGLFTQSFPQVSSSIGPPSSSEQPCNGTYTEMSSDITLDGSTYTFCETYIEGPQDSIVSLTISGTSSIETDSSTVLTVDDLGPGDHYATLYLYNGGAMEGIDNLYSYSPRVRITFNLEEQDGAEFQVQITYTILPLADLRTILTNESGTIDSTEDPSDVTNYQHTWLVETSGGDNVIYFYVENITLDDANGDFVAIGTGDQAFADSPALMFTGQWTEYPSVHVNGTQAYVFLFMKTYSANYTVDLYYNTSMYTPPTLRPPATDPPMYILTAAIKCDDCAMNYTVTVTSLVDTLQKYTLEYCKSDNLEAEVVVTEVVESKPCVTVAFYVDLTNGTCRGNRSFTQQAYTNMMGDYSSAIKDDFGQAVYLSCPRDSPMWILGVVIVLVLAFFTVIFVGCQSRDFKVRRKNKLIPQFDTPEEEEDTDPTMNSMRPAAGSSLDPNFHHPGSRNSNAYVNTPKDDLHYSQAIAINLGDLTKGIKDNAYERFMPAHKPSFPNVMFEDDHNEGAYSNQGFVNEDDLSPMMAPSNDDADLRGRQYRMGSLSILPPIPARPPQPTLMPFDDPDRPSTSSENDTEMWVYDEPSRFMDYDTVYDDSITRL